MTKQRPREGECLSFCTGLSNMTMGHNRYSVHRYPSSALLLMLIGLIHVSRSFVVVEQSQPLGTLKQQQNVYTYFAIPSPVTNGNSFIVETQKYDDEEKKEATDNLGQNPTDALMKGPEPLNDQTTIFDMVAYHAANCLFESDKRRDAKAEHSKLVSSSTTNWINDHTAYILQNTVDRMKLKLSEERTGLDRDEASAWIRWMKSSPVPIIVDLSQELRLVANETLLSDANLHLIETTRPQFLSRLGARIILLPSGMSLSRPFLEPPASLIYGKLIYGGVTRYRRLVSSNSSRKPPRKAGERTLIKGSTNENVSAWIQYGGAERMYKGVDIGSAAVLEVVLLPRGQSLVEWTSNCHDVTIHNFAWKPQDIFGTVGDDATEDRVCEDGTTSDTTVLNLVSGYTPISQAGKDRNDAFQTDFGIAVGGLQPQIDAIVRRVLDGRVLRPAQEGDGVVTDKDETTTALKMAAMEAEELAVLGLTPVRGLLLYGPPGQ
jgi:hypothetical protein